MPNNFENVLEREIRLEIKFEYGSDCSVIDLVYYTEGMEKKVSYERVRHLMSAVFGSYAGAVEEMITNLLSITCRYAPIYEIDSDYLDDVLGGFNFTSDLIDVLREILDTYTVNEVLNAIFNEAKKYAQERGLAYDGDYMIEMETMHIDHYFMPNEPWNAFVHLMQNMDYSVDTYDMGYYAAPQAFMDVYVFNRKIKPEPECMVGRPKKECIAGG